MSDDLAADGTQAQQTGSNDPPSINMPSMAAAASSGQVMDAAMLRIRQDSIEKVIAETAKKQGYGYVDIARRPINPDVFDLVNYQQAVESRMIPFTHLGNNLHIAAVDPSDAKVQQILKDLKEKKYLDLKIYLASEVGINQALERFKPMFGMEAQTVAPVEQHTVQTGPEDYRKEIAVLEKLGSKLHNLGESMEGLSELERGALSTHASDIHFQPEALKSVVRFRIDGVLHHVTELDPKIYNFFVTQMKHKAGMKLNVTDVPQDGRYSFQAGDHKVDVRVSSLPTEYGESLVLRLLDSEQKVLDLAVLGYTDPTLSLLNGAKEVSQGMIMVTGPTGSGKSTTLYTLLQNFNTPERKIITLEDPVEYKLPGIVQSPIKADAGYSFSRGLEAILRQDPDVIMVGEIRDPATAETSAQAALTGHVVLCTLHTNNAIEAIPRFINMGVKPFIAGPALNIIVAQRLVRKLCECKTKKAITDPDRKFIERVLQETIDNDQQVPTEIFQPNGCDKCSHTGFKGRLVIAEGFKVTEKVQELILNQASLKEIRELIMVEQKMRTMIQDGILKVLNGLTTTSEIKRVALF